MAQITLGPLVSNIAGSIGPTTFQRGKGQHFVRRKPLPILRRTKYTGNTRTLTAELSRAWGALSSGDRGNWESEASALKWYDRFGNVILGKGYWLFLRCNQNLQLVGKGVISTPATPPVIPALVGALITSSQVGKLEFGLTTPNPVPASMYLVIAATPPMSAGRGSPFSALRIITVVPPTTGGPWLLDTDYSAYYGTSGVVGRKVFVKAWLIDMASGYAGPPVVVEAIFTP